MNWIIWLSLAVVVTALAAVTGIKPRGTRPVAHSRLMGAGRIVLIILIVIFAVMAFNARNG